MAGLPPASPSAAAAAAASRSAAAADSNKAFVHEVRAARFFYMDQFVLLASGSKLHLYRRVRGGGRWHTPWERGGPGGGAAGMVLLGRA